jgi:hypothetical protein
LTSCFETKSIEIFRRKKLRKKCVYKIIRKIEFEHTTSIGNFLRRIRRRRKRRRKEKGEGEGGGGEG